MGLLNWFFGRPVDKPSTIGPSVATVGRFDCEVVGESRYQDVLLRICGGRTENGHRLQCAAELAEEPANRNDPNAIKVMIGGRQIGYLARHEAARYRTALHKAGLAGHVIHVQAMIVGGWDREGEQRGHFGVRLDMDSPPKFVKR